MILQILQPSHVMCSEYILCLTPCFICPRVNNCLISFISICDSSLYSSRDYVSILFMCSDALGDLPISFLSWSSSSWSLHPLGPVGTCSLGLLSSVVLRFHFTPSFSLSFCVGSSISCPRQWRKGSPFSKWCWERWAAACKSVRNTPSHHSQK